MTAHAAERLGIAVRILTDEATGPEAAFADVTVADWNDSAVLHAFAAGCSAITCESEWAPAGALAAASAGAAIWPAPETLHAIRHKGRQRDALAAARLPQPPYVRAASLSEAQDALTQFGGRVVAKQFEGSYDGYGNATCHSAADVADAWERLAAPDGLLIEAFVPFESEVAVTVARSAAGETAVYPVVRSEHRDHRLHAATLPAGQANDAEAQRIAVSTCEAFGTVGVATVELFRLADGTVLVNEVAPRPHNTAHGSIEACHTSQFENHVRAVLGLPLGDPGLRVPAAVTVNVLGWSDGPFAPDLASALTVRGASIHLYGEAGVPASAQDGPHHRDGGHAGRSTADRRTGARAPPPDLSLESHLKRLSTESGSWDLQAPSRSAPPDLMRSRIEPGLPQIQSCDTSTRTVRPGCRRSLTDRARRRPHRP